MKYSCKYKHKSQWFWRNLKNIKADGIINETRTRFFITDNEERIEVSMTDTIFHFSRERFLVIQQSMIKENN